MPKEGMESKVFLLCCLLSRKRAKAKLNQMDTNDSFLMGGVRRGSISSRPSKQ